MTLEQARRFRPLGSRILVKRFSLPEQSAGGIFVLGRDYPTIGRVIAVGSQAIFWPSQWNNVLVQWQIGSDFDTKLVGPDLLLLDYSDLNFKVSSRTFALGDRLLVDRVPDGGLLDRQSPLEIRQHARSHFALGKVLSVGPGTLLRSGHFVPNNASIGDTIIFNLFRVSETKLNGLDGPTTLIVRDADALATVEQ